MFVLFHFYTSHFTHSPQHPTFFPLYVPLTLRWLELRHLPRRLRTANTATATNIFLEPLPQTTLPREANSSESQTVRKTSYAPFSFLTLTFIERGKGKRKKQSDEKKPKFLIKRRAFSRVVREIANEASTSGQIRFQPGAIEALQTVAEEMLVTEFTCMILASYQRKALLLTTSGSGPSHNCTFQARNPQEEGYEVCTEDQAYLGWERNVA